MSNTLINPLEIDWDQFLSNGYMLQEPHSHTIWGGYGQSDSSSLSFFHTGFFQQNSVFQSPAKVFKVSLLDFLELLKANLPDKIQIEKISDIDEEFLADANSLIKILRNPESNLKKIVPVTSAAYKYIGHPLSAVTRLAELPGFLYGFWNQEQGILGSSPEPLFVRAGGKDNFLALAGTIKASIPRAKQKLLESQKDRVEHNLVIQDISEKLKNIGYIDLEVGKTEIFEFGPLIHLRTEIQADESDIDIAGLVSGLHPTAALLGFPRKESHELLKQQTHYERDKSARLFGGVLGLSSKDLSFGVVMIRNIQWDKNHLYIDSGCGIVADSDAKLELQEVQNKRNAISSLLGGEVK